MAIEKGNKSLIRAWMMYDWANSVYPLVISTAIFPLFYAALTRDPSVGEKVLINGHEQIVVDFLGWKVINTSLISYVGAFGYLLVSFLSPFLSGIADYLGRKKRFLQFFAYLGSFSCMGFYFFEGAAIHWGLLLYLLALIGFCGSLVFYNAYLPEIAEKEDQDRVSSGGFSLGYVGSVFLLILCLVLIKGHGIFGIEGEEEIKAYVGFATRLSFVLVGLWWFGFSHIFLLKVKEDKKNINLSKGVFLNGFKELGKVWKSLKQNKQLKRFLIAFFTFSMGVQTVIMVASYYAEKEIGWENDGQKSTGMILSILLIQLVAVLGAFLASKLSSLIGNIRTLQIINVGWAALSITAYLIETPIGFYITASFVGLVLGGIQSIARSAYSKFLPETDDTSSYFSFYDVSEKVGIVLGMFMFGFLEALTGSMRNSVLLLAGFFLLGFILLSFVPKNKKEA